MVFVNNSTATTVGIDKLFHPTVLRDQMAFESAIGSFEQKLFDPGVDKAKLVDELMSVNNLFELIFSAVSEPSAECIKKSIFQSYPMTASGFNGSQTQRLLDELAKFVAARSLMPSADDSFRSVQSGTQALISISTTFNNTLDSVTEQPSPHVGPARRRKNVFHASQRDQKKARAKTYPAIDSKPFMSLNVDVPTNKVEADSLTREILTTQRRLLEQYLSILRNPDLYDAIKSACVPASLPEPEPELGVPVVSGSGLTEDQSTTATPSAFYMVQSLRAALHFDSPEGFGEWRILIPSSAQKDLRDTRKKDPVHFDTIVTKIKELSTGYFSKDNQKMLNRSPDGIPIFEAKVTPDKCLVYQIDCDQDFETGVECQVIRLYGIYTYTQLARFDWEALATGLAKIGQTYRNRCTQRTQPRKKGDNVIPPATFPPLLQIVDRQLRLQIPGRHVEGEELQETVMLEKFIIFSHDFLTGILADGESIHVFQMSHDEQNVVNYTGSSYVVGRSGTGKTTTMLYKILGIERAWHDYRSNFEGAVFRPRQLFVTQSRMLASKVEEYYGKLAISQGLNSRSTRHYTELFVNLDEEPECRADLPRRFGELEDNHFPLFLTFDDLCKMLEAEYQALQEQSLDGTNLHTFIQAQSQKSNVVTWRRFQSNYWPHFPQNLTKRFEAYLVFAEFMGIIKGSESTLTSATGYLDRTTYKSLGHRAAAMFGDSRTEIYQLFEAYLRLKKENGDVDPADRTHNLLKVMKELGIPGTKVDFIYVDEAQDNLLIDALVIRNLCRNPDGLFWAGDTAQTISAGSAFRFADLKAFLYRVENELRTSSPESSKPSMPPKAFQLAVNYRSHSGIINYSQTIIHIITTFWPHSIDLLKKEESIGDGVKPVMFTGWSEHKLPFEQLLFGDGDNQIEFGAHQCILVRDESAREKLRERVGNIGMIFTLQESKGLEFNDVLIYNFFQDADVPLSYWRVVLNIIPGQISKALDTRHNVVCRELKFLYVAVTRARNNVWIADSSDKGNPMNEVWLSRNQVQVCTPSDEVPTLAVSSSHEEWAERGDLLFKNATYQQAVYCFERANMPHKRDVCKAYRLQQEAFLLPEESCPRILAFTQAADAFIQCAVSAPIPDEAKAYYRQAGRCLLESGDHQRAGDIFLDAEEYTGSARAYRKANLFDIAIRVIQKYSVDPNEANSIIAVARLHFFKNHQVSQIFELDLFESPEEAREYAEDFGFDLVEADIFEKMGQATEAAAIHFREGRYTMALNILLDGPLQSDIQEQCVDYLLTGLWRFLSIGVALSNNLPFEAQSLLRLTSRVIESCSGSMSEHHLTQIAMFQAIEKCDRHQLHSLAKKLFNEHRDKPSAVLCLDHVFNEPPNLEAATMLIEVSSSLEAFLVYATALESAAYVKDPCSKRDIQRLFGFTNSEENIVSVFSGTLLHRELDGDISRDISTRAIVLAPILQRIIKDRLRLRVQDENTLCRKCPPLFPCSISALHLQCPWNSRDSRCCKSHNLRDALSPQSLKLRFRILMQQIQIFHTVEYLVGSKEQDEQRRFWLRSLYDILYPVHHSFGSLENIVASDVPEAQKAFQVINHWVEVQLFSLKSNHPIKRYFINAIVQMSSLAFAFNRSQAQKYLERIPCVRRAPARQYLRGGGRNIVYDVLDFLDGSSEHSTVVGILLLKHVITKKLHIDLNVIGSLVERICCSAVIAYRSQFYNGSLHNTIIPRQWLLTVGSMTGQGVPMHLIYELIQTVQLLFHDVCLGAYSSENHLFYGYSNWNLFDPWQVISISLSHICRSLCFLGFNMGTPPFHPMILKTTSILTKSRDRLSFDCRRYAGAKTWGDLWTIFSFIESHSRSVLDETLFLQDLAYGPSKFIKGLRSVTYRQLNDALSDLHTAATGSSEKTSRITDALVDPPSLDESGVGGESDTIEDANEVSHNNVLPESPPDAVHASAGMKYTEAEKLFTMQQTRAARIIQKTYRNFLARRDNRCAWIIIRAYRRYLRYKRTQTQRSRVEESRQRWKDACRVVAQESINIYGPYNSLFVHSLPHTLVCLEMLYGYVIECKDEDRQRLRSNRAVLEEIHATMQLNIVLFKRVTTLQTDLGPRSDFHHSQNVGLFKQKIQELEQLVQNLPQGVSNEWAFDFRMAMRAVRGVDEVRRKELRPHLNTKDLY